MRRSVGIGGSWGWIALVVWSAAALAQPAPAPAPARATGPLVFFGDRDHAPYEFLDNGVPRGASVDLIEAVGRRLGRPVEIRLLDWSESQRRLLAGEGHALTMLVRNPEREARYEFSRPTLPMSFSLFVRSAEAAAFDPKNLAGRRIGVTAAGLPRIVLSREHPQAQLVIVANLEAGAQALLRGELDALATGTWVGLHLLHRLGLGGVTPMAPFLQLQPSIAVRRGETALLGEIDQALAVVHASGEMARIIDRWSDQRIYTFTGLTVRMGWIAVGVAVLALAGLALAVVQLQRQRTRLAEEVVVRERAETAAEARAAEARMLQRIASSLAASTTPDQVGAELAREAALLPATPRLWLAQPERGGPGWRLLAGALADGPAPTTAADLPAPSEAGSALFEVVASHPGRFVAGDRAALKAALAAAVPAGAPALSSIDALPGHWFYVSALHGAGRLPGTPALGVLLLAWDADLPPGGAHGDRVGQVSLDSVASLVTQALERTQAYLGERRAAAQQAALRVAASALAAAPTVDAVCQVVGDVAREHGRAAYATLALFDEPPEPGSAPAPGAMLTMVPSQTMPGALAQHFRRMAAEAPLAICRAAREGRPAYFEDRAALFAAAPALANLRDAASIHALAAIPLQAPATTDASLLGTSSRLGALSIAFESPRRFDDSDRAFLESLAGMAARAIERCQLLERLQSSLARSEEAGLRARLALESNGMGSFDLDIASHQVEWNSRMYALLGLPPGSGREPVERFFDRVHVDDRPGLHAALDQAIDEDIEFEASFRVHADQGQIRWLMSRGRKLERRGARGTRMLGIAFDITPLMKARQELEAADRNKDEFLAMVSHELRNPLGPILNAAAMLQRAGDRPEVREKMVPLIQRQIRQMTHLIDDLLELSRVRHGRVALRREPVDAAAAVQEALEAIRPAFERHAHQVDLRPSPEALYIDADRARLVQMLSNLLGNAAKYTPPGGRIEIDIAKEGGQAVLRITDNGLGIAPEFLPHLFELFTQDRGSLSRAEGGLGLGLALVKRLAELHGGSIEVASEGRGRGSCFTLRMPLVDDASGSVDSYSAARGKPTYAEKPAA